ncbi:CD209 antigen-like protein C [Toxotes jaculatrix]|uniref:CD209 antigen-like protein C n=1 Tax=Toxotes jaculatrix TaxID=941984 RepID=UPI001B3AD34C|nr:CD209 antigen-like protein C [Toxotes jaculatrix]
MANGDYREEFELKMDVSARSDALQTCSGEEGEEGEVTSAVPGGKLYRLVAVSFGFLCILQAALNISLRLGLSNTEARCKNLTEEIDNLKRINFAITHNMTQEIEATRKNLTKEKDELKRNLTDFEARYKVLTEERDELKRKLTDLVNRLQQGWVYFSGSVYYISSIKKNWEESRNDCLQRGADLMIINSKEEQDFVAQVNDSMWIGLTDRETEGTWKWVDGTPLTISFWVSGEPNSFESTEEDCAELRYHGTVESWNDKPCNYQILWVCEKKVLP